MSFDFELVEGQGAAAGSRGCPRGGAALTVRREQSHQQMSSSKTVPDFGMAEEEVTDVTSHVKRPGLSTRRPQTCIRPVSKKNELVKRLGFPTCHLRSQMTFSGGKRHFAIASGCLRASKTRGSCLALRYLEALQASS